MKKSLRSIITVLLAGALAVGMSACGESSSSSANESTEKPPIQYISEYEESDDSELDAAIKQFGISNSDYHDILGTRVDSEEKVKTVINEYADSYGNGIIIYNGDQWVDIARETAEEDGIEFFAYTPEGSGKDGTETASSGAATDAASAGENNASVNFQTGSYIYTDSDGYQFEVTVKISPWILQSNTDVMNEAWNEVGQGNTLPTLDSWNFKTYEVSTGNDPYYHITNSSHEIFKCEKSNFDMYYAVGTISVKNTTENFNLSETNKRSIDLWVGSNSFGRGDEDSNAITEVFYSNEAELNDRYVNIPASHNTYRALHMGNASMSNDSWGPVTFLIAHGESSSPNYPDGEYYQQLKDNPSIGFFTDVSDSTAMINVRDNIDSEDHVSFSLDVEK